MKRCRSQHRSRKRLEAAQTSQPASGGSGGSAIFSSCFPKFSPVKSRMSVFGDREEERLNRLLDAVRAMDLSGDTGSGSLLDVLERYRDGMRPLGECLYR